MKHLQVLHKKENKKGGLKMNDIFTKILQIMKLILFITMLILSYFVSEKFIDYVLTVDINTLKRVVNIILVVLIVLFYTIKKPVKNA